LEDHQFIKLPSAKMIKIGSRLFKIKPYIILVHVECCRCVKVSGPAIARLDDLKIDPSTGVAQNNINRLGNSPVEQNRKKFRVLFIFDFLEAY
jgi:hypothetical protein